MIEEVHLVIMVVSFVWHAVHSYANTPEGAAELADIQAVEGAMSGTANPSTGQTGTNSTGGSARSGSTPSNIAPRT